MLLAFDIVESSPLTYSYVLKPDERYIGAVRVMYVITIRPLIREDKHTSVE
jgi:hypothetical protein